jgi:hypothetical protein
MSPRRSVGARFLASFATPCARSWITVQYPKDQTLRG